MSEVVADLVTGEAVQKYLLEVLAEAYKDVITVSSFTDGSLLTTGIPFEWTDLSGTSADVTLRAGYDPHEITCPSDSADDFHGIDFSTHVEITNRTADWPSEAYAAADEQDTRLGAVQKGQLIERCFDLQINFSAADDVDWISTRDYQLIDLGTEETICDITVPVDSYLGLELELVSDEADIFASLCSSIGSDVAYQRVYRRLQQAQDIMRCIRTRDPRLLSYLQPGSQEQY